MLSWFAINPMINYYGSWCDCQFLATANFAIQYTPDKTAMAKETKTTTDIISEVAYTEDNIQTLRRVEHICGKSEI